jgi:hypothetical protein
MLSEEEFLKLFKKPKKQTYKEFIEKYKVKTSNNTYILKEYMVMKNEAANSIVISREDLESLQYLLENNESYLQNFYNRSLRLSNTFLHEEEASKVYDNNKLVKYKNIIRNLHFYDILQNTTSGFVNKRSYLDVIFDLFNNKIIDYRILAPTSLYYIRNGGFGGVLSNNNFRASIMNPYLVYSLNITLLKGTKVFTPTLGWTSYLYGLLESQIVTHYVGTDVIKSVCDKTRDFAKDYPDIKTKIFNKPSESLLKMKTFSQKYKNYFDLVFFSPPYYKYEVYDSDNQSTDTYKKYDEWLDKYWRETVKLCHYVLKKNGRMCYILSGYGSENTENYDLIGDMNKITNEKFNLIKKINMLNKDVYVTSDRHKETAEKIMLYMK